MMSFLLCLCVCVGNVRYRSSALAGAHADQRVLAVLLRRWQPDVMAVIEGLDVSRCALPVTCRFHCPLTASLVFACRRQLGISVVSLEWFMALFSTTLPTHTALRVWDVFFLCGVEG